MSEREIKAVIYDGVKYPITNEVGDALIEFIGSFEIIAQRDFYRIPTTDGRQIVLNLGPSIPIAFEAIGE